MSAYRGRAGQRIGDLEVVRDHKRTASGKAIWLCREQSMGRERYRRTEEIIRLDRERG